jgi:hypothetical protein
VIIGQIAIVLIVLGGLGLCLLLSNINPSGSIIPLAIWVLTFIPLGVWTRFNPKTAFTVAGGYYSIGVIIKDIVYGGEYLLPFLFHIYFLSSIIVGTTGANKQRRRAKEVR